jgi:hypothetical protein
MFIVVVSLDVRTVTGTLLTFQPLNQKNSGNFLKQIAVS